MGMFDRIKIDEDVNLSCPEKPDFISISELEFQTKDLDNLLSTYVLKKSGLYLLEDDGKLVNKNFHGVLTFGAYHSTDLVDYLFDFKAKYTDGVLVDVSLHRFQEFFHDSTEERLKSLFDRQKSRRKSLLFITQSLLVNFLARFGLNIESNFLGSIKIGNVFLNLHCPKLLLLKKLEFTNFSSYGIMIENLDFGFKFRSSSYEKFFCLKFFGFGFELRSYCLLLEELSNSN